MILGPVSPAVAATTRCVASSAASGGLTEAQVALSTVDHILTGLALIFLSVMVVTWLARGRGDPLRQAPTRPNEVHEDSLALAIVAYMGAMAAFSGVVGLVSGQTDSLLTRMVVGNGGQVVAAGVVLVIGARRFAGGVRRFLMGHEVAGRTSWFWMVASMTLVGIGVCPLIQEGTIEVILFFVPEYQPPAHPTMQALHEARQPIGVIIAIWVGAVVIAPVAEELFFRGLLQTFLVGVLGRRGVAILVTSVAFGAVHFFQPDAVGALAVLAVLIGYSYERTGSLVVPILIHAAFNLKTLVWDALGTPPT